MNVTRTKKLSALLLITALLLSEAFATEQAAAIDTQQQGRLLIRITDFANMDGDVRIAVFNSEETWLNSSIFSNVLKLSNTHCADMACEWEIEQVPYGEYGIAIFHDENGNGELDKYFIGLPKEDYGFSNNETVPPKWKNAKFSVNAKQVEHLISLQ